MPQPSVGRIVHYHSYGTPGGEYLPEARAAIVTEVKYLGDSASEREQRVSLAIFNPAGIHFNSGVPFSETPKPGHWSWPPRA